MSCVFSLVSILKNNLLIVNRFEDFKNVKVKFIGRKEEIKLVTNLLIGRKRALLILGERFRIYDL